MLQNASTANREAFKNLQDINKAEIEDTKRNVTSSINYAILKGEFMVEVSWDSDISRPILKWLSDLCYVADFKRIVRQLNGTHRSTFKISWDIK